MLQATKKTSLWFLTMMEFFLTLISFLTKQPIL